MSSIRTRAGLVACALPAALILAAMKPADAAGGGQNTFFPADATINYTVGSAVIGYADQSDFNAGTNGTSPTVTVAAGGRVISLDSENASTIDLTGGTVGYLNSESRGTVNVNGGTVTSQLNSFGASTVNVGGGNVAFLGANNEGTTFVSGGTIGALAADGTDTLLVTGGSLTGGVDTANASKVTLRGGTFGLVSDGINDTFDVNFLDGTTGGFTFVGTGLAAVDIGKSTNGLGEDYLLSGLLQDGQSITGDKIQVQGQNVTFTLDNLAPEPSHTAALSLGALGLAGLALRARRRTA